MNKIELLAPAGSFEKAKIAFLYGADAVYMGTKSLSLRTRVSVDDNELNKTIEYAHKIGKKVYVAFGECSIYTYVNRKMRNPKTTRKMSDFRIFCELLAKMMLESIDFTDVLEGYRRNEKPEILGIATEP